MKAALLCILGLVFVVSAQAAPQLSVSARMKGDVDAELLYEGLKRPLQYPDTFRLKMFETKDGRVQITCSNEVSPNKFLHPVVTNSNNAECLATIDFVSRQGPTSTKIVEENGVVKATLDLESSKLLYHSLEIEGSSGSSSRGFTSEQDRLKIECALKPAVSLESEPVPSCQVSISLR